MKSCGEVLPAPPGADYSVSLVETHVDHTPGAAAWISG